MIKRIFLISFILCLLIPASAVLAQTPTPPPGPVYIIQPGDSLSSIASRFGVVLADLMSANGITDANSISAGAQLIIPGLQGISGVLTTEIVGYGDTLNSLSRSNQIDVSFLRKLNHITSSSEIYAGTSLVLPKKDNFTPLNKHIVLSSGESLLEAAVMDNSDPWTLAQVNHLDGTWDGTPGDTLYSPAADPKASGPSGLPGAFEDVSVKPLPMLQGGTSEIIIKTQPGVTLSGMLVDKPLHFFKMDDGRYAALEGIHAMLDPGAYPLELDASLPDGTKQSFQQMIIVTAGNYPRSVMLEVDPETIDPAVTGPEDKQVATITGPATPDKLWDGMFKLPVDPAYCTKAGFGERRAFNGSDYIYFHAGLDFGVCSPTNPFDIYAAADGIVVYTGTLIVRGNATIINHGWGIYTGYWHQSQILVNIGDHVKAGQLIGKIGQTGRVTGPHLHFEVWVNGVQVNPSGPTGWLKNIYP